MSMDNHSTISRRNMLRLSALGLGGLSLTGLPNLSDAAAGDPLAPITPHHAPRAKRVIFLFMHGGPSHVDTFDFKPKLQKDDGKPLPFARSEEHTSELQSRRHLVCRLLL